MKKNKDNDLKNKDNDEAQDQEAGFDQSKEESANEPEKQADEMELLKQELNSKNEMIKQFEALIEEQKERHLRLQADFDNYRKRVAREREDIFVSALEDIMIQMLPILDNFERALDSFRTSDLDKKYFDGLEMIYKDFIGTLRKNGLEEIEALNCEFDPNKHHAVMQEEAQEDDENKVKDVFQKGYMLKTKVIRPAMVKVATKG